MYSFLIIPLLYLYYTFIIPLLYLYYTFIIPLLYLYYTFIVIQKIVHIFIFFGKNKNDFKILNF